ncbi:MAG: hypothetical protein JXM69_11885 [Anaerolineae bacterium]|nr:hypothetical protein [Anaerolineae bacterium]
MTSDNHTWTNQLYRIADFLYWEPQRINRQKRQSGDMQAYQTAMSNLRTLEVPLNRLFDVMIHLSPQRVKRRILAGFLPVTEVDFGQQIEYLSIYDRLAEEETYFIQPDTVLASKQAHICIELKIDKSPLTLNQVYKYLALLGLWQTKIETSTTPYLFLLTQKNLATQWTYGERAIVFTEADDLTSLQHFLRTADLPQKFNWTAASINPHKMIEEIRENAILGWASWQTVGDILDAELRSLDQDGTSEGAEILQNLLGDFLTELTHRGLWKSTAWQREA